MGTVQKIESKSEAGKSDSPQISKNRLILWAVILLFVLAGSGAVVTQQMKNNSSQEPSTVGNPVASSAPLQMQSFDLNSVPLTLANSDAVFAQNENTIASVLANSEDDLNQLNQINAQTDVKGL